MFTTERIHSMSGLLLSIFLFYRCYDFLRGAPYQLFVRGPIGPLHRLALLVEKGYVGGVSREAEATSVRVAGDRALRKQVLAFQDLIILAIKSVVEVVLL